MARRCLLINRDLSSNLSSGLNKNNLMKDFFIKVETSNEILLEKLTKAEFKWYNEKNLKDNKPISVYYFIINLRQYSITKNSLLEEGMIYLNPILLDALLTTCKTHYNIIKILCLYNKQIEQLNELLCVFKE